MFRCSRSACHICPHPSQRQYDDGVGLSPLVTLVEWQYGHRADGWTTLSAGVDDTQDLRSSDRSHANDIGEAQGFGEVNAGGRRQRRRVQYM